MQFRIQSAILNNQLLHKERKCPIPYSSVQSANHNFVFSPMYSTEEFLKMCRIQCASFKYSLLSFDCVGFFSTLRDLFRFSAKHLHRNGGKQ